MLSNSLILKDHIYSICAASGDILIGDTFRGVQLAENDTNDLTDTVIVCCGRLKDDEMLFRTLDGRYYFSLCDGFGTQDGVLYGLSRGIFFDFKRPTTEEMILSKYRSWLGTYHTWGGAMAYQARKHALDAIVTVLKKEHAVV